MGVRFPPGALFYIQNKEMEKIKVFSPKVGRLAQLVEQFPLKESVQGSSPWSLTS